VNEPWFSWVRRIVAAWLLTAALTACGPADGPHGNSEPVAATVQDATFVGGTACATCHPTEADAWNGSHHDLAMQTASPDTVLGDFGNTRFDYGGITTTFSERAGEYWVNTEGSDGELRDFRVAYSFGITPLQQYLLELPGGRLQALSIAWDTRGAEAGGQRWFYLYPDQQIDSNDPLHWTGRYQNWNTMCAECHSTNVRKRYDLQSDRFETTFSSIDVDCEACHGPGSAHAADPTVPLTLPSTARSWIFADGARIASLTPAAVPSLEIEICAQCHARRSQLSDDHDPGDPFLDAYRPALLEENLYQADGQILDEVYVYGSFQQSAMAAAGVVCSDCHEPHSATLRSSGNGVCARCHLPTAFDSTAHHHHQEGSSGAQCVSCHMRSKTYMVVDPRRDHSFRVPRPDLSVRLETPNACNDCHAERTADWAAARIADWFPDGRHLDFHYGEALAAGRRWAEDSAPLLRRVIADTAQPAIARATALELIAMQMDERVVGLLRAALDDNDPLLKLTALDLLPGTPDTQRIELAQRFLADPLLALRIAAARALVGLRDRLEPARLPAFTAALTDYIAVQEFIADRAEGLVNLGGLAIELGELERAEAYYRTAIERDPGVPASYVNLADLYRMEGREDAVEETLRRGLAASPNDAGLHFTLALSLVRSGRLDAAISEIDSAVALAPASPYYAYVRGIALNSTGQEALALQALRATHARFPGHRATLVALATITRDTGDIRGALDYARMLLELTPNDAAAQTLVAQLEAASGN